MATLDKVSELGDYLREQRHGAKLSLRQLAEVAGVSNPYLSQVERGLRRPSAEVLQQIAKGLRISAEALYVRAGILEEREDRITVEAAVLADPKLSERQRRVLLDIYATFCAEQARQDPDRPAGDDATAGPQPGAAPATGTPDRATGTPAQGRGRGRSATRSAATRSAATRSAATRSAATGSTTTRGSAREKTARTRSARDTTTPRTTTRPADTERATRGGT